MSEPTPLYINTYHPHLSPPHMRLALLKAGYAAPKVAMACELGFGQGISLNVHAAADPNVIWYGNDLHPQHVANARALARSSGVDAHLFEESFEQFCARDDLPEFDFIAMHGVWSWISDANRQCVVDFVRRKLKVGGVFSVSYNTLHGWMAMHPVRDLLTGYVKSKGTLGSNPATGIDEALGYVDRLMQARPDFAEKHPATFSKFNGLKYANRAYLAGEYFDAQWHPMSFSQVAGYLELANCTYAGQDIFARQLDFLLLSDEQMSLLAEVKDPRYRETVRDFLMQNSFRKDYWVKSPASLSETDQRALWRSQQVEFAAPAAEVRIHCMVREGDPVIHASNLDLLLRVWDEVQPENLGAWADAMACHGLDWPGFLRWVWVFMGYELLQPVDSRQASARAALACQGLNASLLERVCTDRSIRVMASPVTRLGVPLSAHAQMFMLACAQGKQTVQDWVDCALAWVRASGGVVKPTELTRIARNAGDRGLAQSYLWAEQVLQFLKSQGRLPQKSTDDCPPLTEDEARFELTFEAQNFQRELAPVLERLGILTQSDDLDER
jgi:SAM-dependent methyltransferase